MIPLSSTKKAFFANLSAILVVFFLLASLGIPFSVSGSFRTINEDLPSEQGEVSLHDIHCSTENICFLFYTRTGEGGGWDYHPFSIGPYIKVIDLVNNHTIISTLEIPLEDKTGDEIHYKIIFTQETSEMLKIVGWIEDSGYYETIWMKDSKELSISKLDLSCTIGFDPEDFNGRIHLSSLLPYEDILCNSTTQIPTETYNLDVSSNDCSYKAILIDASNISHQFCSKYLNYRSFNVSYEKFNQNGTSVLYSSWEQINVTISVGYSASIAYVNIKAPIAQFKMDNVTYVIGEYRNYEEWGKNKVGLFAVNTETGELTFFPLIFSELPKKGLNDFFLFLIAFVMIIQIFGIIFILFLRKIRRYQNSKIK